MIQQNKQDLPKKAEELAKKIAFSSQKNKPRFSQISAVKWGLIGLGIALITAIGPQYLKASDHDDGETDYKGRNLNLTDLFVFREGDQNRSASTSDLVFIMNTNPRSLPRQQYYFSTRASYDFKITRVADINAEPTGVPDVILRFEFSEPFGTPQTHKQQRVRMTLIRDGVTTVASQNILTTPLIRSPIINQVPIAGSNVSVFAGLREDPFFFDVQQFFRVRAGALGFGPRVGFLPPEKAEDFAKDYNVNAIAVRVPIRLLRGSTSANIFDVWETIAIRENQVERLARPAINEGLVITNDFLNAFNQIPPSADLSPAAAPVREEALRTLTAFSGSQARATALADAFLPDVMRIDTRGPSGYAKALNAEGSPVRGRLLKDDVVDITLSVLTGNPMASDNVTYEGVPGNPAQGHKPLVTTFPYLALPN